MRNFHKRILPLYRYLPSSFDAGTQRHQVHSGGSRQYQDEPAVCGQHLETYAKYKEVIVACDSMDYIEYNVSQIARESGLTGTNLGRQLHTHYPEVLEFREWAW